MKVLLVEDDPSLREILRNGLILSFPTFEIEAVEDAEAAEEKIAGDFLPRLMICDVRLPGKTGLDLVLDLQDRLAETQFILMSGYAAPDAMEQIRPQRMLRFLPKPFDLGVLVREVQSAFVKDQFSGTHRRISFLDVLQMLNLAGRTARLGIRGEGGAEVGAIYVVDGEVHHAECAGFEGVAAFRALCVDAEAFFRVKSNEKPPRRTIDKATGLLLMDVLGEEDDERSEEVSAPEEAVREGLGAMCRDLVEGLAEAKAAAVFDLVSRECLGSAWSASFSEQHAAAMSRLAEHLFRSPELDAVGGLTERPASKRPAQGALSEVQLKTDTAVHCLARLPGLEAAAWLVLDAGAASGTGWATLRMTVAKMGPLAAAGKRL